MWEQNCISRGRVESRLLRLRQEGALHLSLIDPQKSKAEEIEKLADFLASVGTDAFLVGGSTGICPFEAEQIVKALKKTGLPVILFPGGLSNIVPSADAILFLSLLNSDDPYFIVGAQVQGALLIKRYGIEAIPTAYVIVGHGGTAGHVGKARPIPYENSELVACYVLAASMLGMRFAYLEAGSGAPKPVPPEAVKRSKELSPETFLLVGGGIRTPETAEGLVEAGADALVTGTLLERNPALVKDIVRAIKQKK